MLMFHSLPCFTVSTVCCRSKFNTMFEMALNLHKFPCLSHDIHSSHLAHSLENDSSQKRNYHFLFSVSRPRHLMFCLLIKRALSSPEHEHSWYGNRGNVMKHGHEIGIFRHSQLFSWHSIILLPFPAVLTRCRCNLFLLSELSARLSLGFFYLNCRQISRILKQCSIAESKGRENSSLCWKSKSMRELSWEKFSQNCQLDLFFPLQYP